MRGGGVGGVLRKVFLRCQYLNGDLNDVRDLESELCEYLREEYFMEGRVYVKVLSLVCFRKGKRLVGLEQRE